MSAEDKQPRRVIVIELVVPTEEPGNDAATVGVSARIQQKHDFITTGVVENTANQGMLTPAGVEPDALRDHEAEARIIDKAGPRLKSVLAERAKLVKSHAIESAGSAAGAVLELKEMKRELEIQFHVRAEYKLGQAIEKVVGFWVRSWPSTEEIVRDTIKGLAISSILATAVYIGSQVIA